MEELQRKHISNKLVILIKNTICSPDFVKKLVNAKILNTDDEESLAKLTRYGQSKRLFEILPDIKGAYDVLIRCLEETGQDHVAKILKDTEQHMQAHGQISFDTKHVLGKGLGTVVHKGYFDDRNVAVKVISSLLVSPDNVLKEVKFLKKLDNHENIIRYFTVERGDQFSYIALELCLINLDDEIKIKLVDLQPLEILKKCTTGLAHLHKHNIIHRDLKPANILLNELRQVKISDFGLSKQIPDGSTSVSVTGVVGSTDWMAPENINNISLEEKQMRMTTASDMFSLGCIFYYVLSNGLHPFGEISASRPHLISRGESQLNPTLVDENWLELIKTMISQNARKRPSALDVLFQDFNPKRNASKPNVAPKPTRLPFLTQRNNDIDFMSKDTNTDLLNSSIETNLYSLQHYSSQPVKQFTTTTFDNLKATKLDGSIPPKPTKEYQRESAFSPPPRSKTSQRGDLFQLNRRQKVTLGSTSLTDFNSPHLQTASHQNKGQQRNHVNPQSGNTARLFQGNPIEYETLLSAKVQFMEQILTLRELGILKEDLEEVMDMGLFEEEYLAFKSKPETPFPFVADTVPTAPPIYLHRKLISDVVLVNPEIFKTNCSDIFVFKGVQPDQLPIIARQRSTSISGEEISSDTSRFMIFEEIPDWDMLRIRSKDAIHIVKRDTRFYDTKIGPQEQSIYILEQTHGESNVLPHYKKRLSGNDKIFLSEKDFIIRTEMDPTILISDTPGMGKTMLLGNLARTIRLTHTQRALAFISMPKFMNTLDTSKQVSLTPSNALSLVVEHITRSPMGQSLLLVAIQRNRIKLDIFFDEFDKMYSQHVHLADILLRALTKLIKGVRIYVCTSNYHRLKLEKVLGVITSYSITPFEIEDQKECLFNVLDKFQTKVDSSNLKNLGVKFITYMMTLKKPGERDILGIPTFCNLFANVFVENAEKFFNSEAERSQHFEKNIDLSTTNLLFKTYQTFLNQRISITKSESRKGGSDIDDNSILRNRVLRRFHVYKALSVILPEIAEEYFRIHHLQQLTNNAEYIAYGVLEAAETKHNLEPVFIHRTLAEYMGSEYLADILTTKTCGPFHEQVIIRVVEDVFLLAKDDIIQLSPVGHVTHQTDKPTYIENSLYTFINFTNVSFLNEHLCDRSAQSIDQNVATCFFSYIKLPKLYQILLCLARYGYIGLLRYIKELLTYIDNFTLGDYQAYFSKMVSLYLSTDVYASVQRSFLLLCVAAQYSDLEMVKELFVIFDECFNYDISNTLKNSPATVKTPLHWAIERRDIELVKFLVEKSSLENRLLLYYCVDHTYLKVNESSRNMIKEICKLLLDKNSSLLKEKDTYVGLTVTHQRQGPLVAEKVDLELLKFLIQLGADIRVTYDGNQTIVQRAVRYMTENEFYELCRFLIENMKALDLFKPNMVDETLKWKSPLHQIMQEGEEGDALKVLKCLDIKGVNVHEEDEDGNNFILCLVQGAHNRAILSELYKHQINHLAVNKKGQNALHLSVVYKENKRFNVDAVQHLISLGVSTKHKDKDGNTPLHQAELTSRHMFLTSFFRDELRKLDLIIELLRAAESSE